MAPTCSAPAPGAADALYAPDCLRLHTYSLDPGPYCHTITALPALQEWTTTQAIIETIDDYDHPQSTPDIPQGPDQ